MMTENRDLVDQSERLENQKGTKAIDPNKLSFGKSCCGLGRASLKDSF